MSKSESTSMSAALLNGDAAAANATENATVSAHAIKNGAGNRRSQDAERGDVLPTRPVTAMLAIDPLLLMERQNAIKVIKGEIHNVLNVMRSDARYASPLRFVEEVGLEEHPLLLRLKELDDMLTHADLKEELKLLQYLQPFCSAISGRDISASVTGAALNALHKFLLYGFIVEQTPSAREGMALVAKSLLHCTFEESTHGPDGKRRPNALAGRQTQAWHDDEQVVLKLLGLAALVVRVSLQRTASFLDATLVVGLLDTCLHVSHRAKHASGLLKSAATDASCQIVLVVFQVDPDVGDVSQARATILSSLANLVNPSQSTDQTCVTSLTLVNIALETMKQQPSVAEIAILHNDLCKHLLQWSTTHDLVILSLTLRVIFNLFQTIRNHMKVPLEIFLTSVHLRILDPSIKNFRDEQREVALESLLEFCQEPAMMQDLYLNYDCDVHCTNLFESICGALSRMASPEGTFVNAIHRLGMEGLLAVVDSIARKCVKGERFLKTSTTISDDDDNASSDGTDDSYGKVEETHKVLQERKRKKHAIQLVAHEFSRNNSGWMKMAQEMELFDDPTPAAVASFLYTTPQLDKTQLGLYLSKGPDDKYPFNAQVRSAFCSLFDFSQLGFSGSLRKFLSKFRLPGEAQCIDRLMESFSTELYKQQVMKLQKSLAATRNVGISMYNLAISDDDAMAPSANFKSSDAVFRMAFSTIMLNTDLHNPGMRDDKRMTLEEFIRNNRGLNDDEDFPVEFLTFLYNDFRENELQVQKEFLDVIRRHYDDSEIPAKHWQGILKRRHEPAYFTPADAAHSHLSRASIHDRDMFVSIAKAATQSISNVFVKSTNDALVTKAIRGFQQMSKICVYFDLDETFNEILQILLGHGRDYIMSCIALEYAGLDSAEIMAAGPTPSSHGGSSTNFEGSSKVGAVNENGVTMPMPAEFLIKSTSFTEINEVMTGAAAHRGLLSLDCGFALIRKQPDRIREAWPTLIECLCALRDARALPDRVIFLDDFADSRGNLLPLSPFAKQSQRRLDEYYRSLGSERDKKKSWMSSFFSAKKEEHGLTSMFHGDVEGAPDANEKALSSFSHSLLQVTKRAKLEQVVLMRPKNLPMAKQTVRALLDAIDAYPYFDDPIFEQHAVYSLELALLALISNRDRSADLYPAFLEKFATVLQGAESAESPPAGGNPKNMPTPFLMERVVVTILRACIHLYDIPEARPLLKRSLHLLMTLPPNFTRFVSDRIACGMAIFLSCKFQLLENAEDWEFITNMLDMLAYFGPGRGFVFDGIANTVESQMMVPEHGEEKQVLTLEGAQMLTKPLLKFVFGTYQNDISLSIPAMMCLENLYRHIALLNCNDDSENAISVNGEIMVHDQVLWQNIAVAFYAVCRNADPSTSLQGTDCFQRFIASTPMGSLPDEKWIVLLHLICHKQPPVTSEAPRVNCTTLLCKILLMSIAHLSQKEEYWEDLTDIVNQMAVLVGENLRMGRRGNVSPLFESTLQSVTFLCNHMVSDNFTGHVEYGNWVSDTLLSELEKVGASGGSAKNLAATKSVEGSEYMEMNER